MFLSVTSSCHLWIQGLLLQCEDILPEFLNEPHVQAHKHTPGKLNINLIFYSSSFGYGRSKDLFQHVSPPALCHQKSSTTQIRLVIQTGKTITLVSSNSLWSLSALVFSKSRLCSSSLMRACSSLVCVC